MPPRPGYRKPVYTAAMALTAREAYEAGATLKEAAQVVQMKHSLLKPPSVHWVSSNVKTRSVRRARQLASLGNRRDDVQRHALDMARRGCTSREIREALGLSQQMVRSLLKDMAPSRQRSQVRRWAKTEWRRKAIERARELRANGWQLQEIADEIGRSKTSVFVWTRGIRDRKRAS